MIIKDNKLQIFRADKQDRIVLTAKEAGGKDRVFVSVLKNNKDVLEVNGVLATIDEWSKFISEIKVLIQQ